MKENEADVRSTAPTSNVDAEQLKTLGYAAKFDRSMTLWENFALGFTYLSPVVGVYSVFDVGMAAGGPPMIWSYFLAAFGQFIVCLTFCEVVSQFPISGGLYPWARRLVGKRWASIAGSIYGWALFATSPPSPPAPRLSWRLCWALTRRRGSPLPSPSPSCCYRP